MEERVGKVTRDGANTYTSEQLDGRFDQSGQVEYDEDETTQHDKRGL